MENNQWTGIIDELTEQLKVVSIERAVARSTVNELHAALAEKDREIDALRQLSQEDPDVVQ